MDIKVATGIVSNRLIKPKTVLSLMNMLAYTEIDTFPVVATEGYTIAEGRNYCVWQAIKNGCTHILFIDDDMTFPEDTIERLLAHRKEIVGVYSYSRLLPLSPTVAFLDEAGEFLPKDKIPFIIRPKELFKCYSIGMGVALIDMKLFDVIDKPWFSWEVHENGKILVGEDAWLCKQARAKGVDIYCDPTLPIGHLGEYSYGPNLEEHGTV